MALAMPNDALLDLVSLVLDNTNSLRDIQDLPEADEGSIRATCLVLRRLLEHSSPSPASTPSLPPPPTSPAAVFMPHPEPSRKLAGQTRATRQRTVDAVYLHDAESVIEYPHTEQGGVVHIFPLQRLPDDADGKRRWHNPARDFAYSHTNHSSNRNRLCRDIVDLVPMENRPDEVKFKYFSTQCGGVKVCEFADEAFKTAPHRFCTPQLLRERVSHRAASTAADKQLFGKTVATKVAYDSLGCGSKLSQGEVDDLGVQTAAGKRCPGKLILHHGQENNLYIRCEFFSKSRRTHRNSAVRDVHHELLEALFEDDSAAIAFFESRDRDEHNPLTPCKFAVNANAQREECDSQHFFASEDDSPSGLRKGRLIPSRCEVRFVTYMPEEEYCDTFPYAIVISRGVHTHPLPLPSKTPGPIRRQLEEILHAVGSDLADATTRRLQRNGIVKAKLSALLPGVHNPTFADLHPSLANPPQRHAPA